MGKPIIMVSSVTYAMKGRDLLFSRGIRAYVERTSRIRENAGCGYSLYVPKQTDEAEAILSQAGIHVMGRAEREGAV